MYRELLEPENTHELLQSTSAPVHILIWLKAGYMKLVISVNTPKPKIDMQHHLHRKSKRQMLKLMKGRVTYPNVATLHCSACSTRSSKTDAAPEGQLRLEAGQQCPEGNRDPGLYSRKYGMLDMLEAITLSLRIVEETNKFSAKPLTYTCWYSEDDY